MDSTEKWQLTPGSKPQPAISPSQKTPFCFSHHSSSILISYIHISKNGFTTLLLYFTLLVKDTQICYQGPSPDYSLGLTFTTSAFIFILIHNHTKYKITMETSHILTYLLLLWQNSPYALSQPSHQHLPVCLSTDANIPFNSYPPPPQILRIFQRVLLSTLLYTFFTSIIAAYHFLPILKLPSLIMLISTKILSNEPFPRLNS